MRIISFDARYAMHFTASMFLVVMFFVLIFNRVFVCVFCSLAHNEANAGSGLQSICQKDEIYGIQTYRYVTEPFSKWLSVPSTLDTSNSATVRCDCVCVHDLRAVFYMPCLFVMTLTCVREQVMNYVRNQYSAGVSRATMSAILSSVAYKSDGSPSFSATTAPWCGSGAYVGVVVICYRTGVLCSQ